MALYRKLNSAADDSAESSHVPAHHATRELLRDDALILFKSGMRASEANTFAIRDVQRLAAAMDRITHRLVVCGKAGERHPIPVAREGRGIFLHHARW